MQEGPTQCCVPTLADDFDGLVRNCSNSITLAIDLTTRAEFYHPFVWKCFHEDNGNNINVILLVMQNMLSTFL